MKKKIDEKRSFLFSLLSFVHRLLITIAYMPYLLYWNIRSELKDDVIFMEASTKMTPIGFKKSNWGDDLNKYFIEVASGRKVAIIPYNSMIFENRRKRYSMIGSTIGFYNLSNLDIYGSGIMNEKIEPRGGWKLPRTIVSVRGPLTKRVLEEHGIACPEVFGDPALLLPMVYNPKVVRTGRISIIANCGTDVSNGNIKRIIESHNCNTVSMTDYHIWTDVIDEIVGSKCVLSESLHGIIVAETYGIPCLWVELIPHAEGWDFKFKDFYGSIGKSIVSSLKLYEEFDEKEIRDRLEQWQKVEIDYDYLMSCFPFPFQKSRRW